MAQITYKPSKDLDQLVQDINDGEGWVTYKPEENKKKMGVILYPGAKVEPEAYSYIAEQLSGKGYLVGIPDVMLNLPMFDINKAEEAINKYDSIEKWYVGGHSLGGVSAASFAQSHPEKVEGLIFLASYPSKGNSFADSDLLMLSIYAENDGLSTVDEIKEKESLLSGQAAFYEIKGGNHAKFGVYGSQKGDEKAVISVEKQQDIIVNVIFEWLENQ
ncbi:alpha/beta hydrolase [Halobacillus mangrovi]|uniref:alpha/beta hydrolase n=1 Tax=Halobacillus mangrovi TaxID=402384 RepID=UPI001E5A9699|nr:alpha/beta hydrolase [Halobacillus mangrovi]